MLSFSGSLKVSVAVEACDVRKGFNGLHGLVTEKLGEDPRQGALFVFSNRRHTRIKILCWDGTGLWVLSKRLEEGTFSWPRNLEPQTIKLKLSPQALAMLTDGVNGSGVHKCIFDIIAYGISEFYCHKIQQR
jgi:transposase